MNRAVVAVISLAACLLAARAEDVAAYNFEGTGKVVTPAFIVPNRWEVRWSQASSINISVAQANRTIIAGVTATGNGSLYMPTGGQFYLIVSGTPAAGASSWKCSVVQIGSGPSSDPEAYAPPDQFPRPSRAVDGAVQPIEENSRGQALAPTLIQTHATVEIVSGPNVADGFFAHAPDGKTVVITNSHVISESPDFKVVTTDGRAVKVLGYRGAVDRDAIMLTIEDKGFTGLDFVPDASRVLVGEAYLIPANIGGGEAIVGSTGKVTAVTPDKVELSVKFFHSPLGAPVIDMATGKVLGVACMSLPANPAELIDAPSAPDPQAVIANSAARYALRLDNVMDWENYDWNKFTAESKLLQDFHRQTCVLDSLLNGDRYEKAHLPVATNSESYLPNAQVYLTDERVHALAQSFRVHAGDVDKSLQIEAAREFCSGLLDIANSGLREMQAPRNFYQFNKRCAADEVAYRKGIIDEINKAGDKIVDLVH